MPSDIYRTVYQVEVFSDGPFVPNGNDNDPFDLIAINYAIYEGDCIGAVHEISREVIPPKDVEAHLLRIGNDGTFFSMDDSDEW